MLLIFRLADAAEFCLTQLRSVDSGLGTAGDEEPIPGRTFFGREIGPCCKEGKNVKGDLTVACVCICARVHVHMCVLV